MRPSNSSGSPRISASYMDRMLPAILALSPRGTLSLAAFFRPPWPFLKFRPPVFLPFAMALCRLLRSTGHQAKEQEATGCGAHRSTREHRDVHVESVETGVTRQYASSAARISLR